MHLSKALALAFASMLSGAGAHLGAAPEAAVRLLVLNSDGPESAAPAGFDEISVPALQEKLGARVEEFTEYLVLNRFTGPEHERELAQSLRTRYQNRDIRLLVTVGFPALDFARRHAEQFLAGIPVVFVAVEKRRIEGSLLPRNFTGVVHEDTWPWALGEILRLAPKTREVVVVAGSAPFDREYLEDLKKRLRPFEGHVKFRYLSELPMLDTLAVVSRLPSDTIVLQCPYTVDSRGQALSEEGVPRLIYRAASVPVFALVGKNLGDGFVGGPMAAYRERYLETADIAYQLLRGLQPREIAVRTAVPEHPMAFDWRQLQRWHISEVPLPANSLVAFRADPPWRQYSRFIASAAAIVLAEAALIFGLLIQRSRRRRAETSLRLSRNRVRNLAGRLIVAQEDERKRIARDLHDDLSQQLAVLGILVSSIKRDLDASSGPAYRRLEDLQKRLRAAGDGVRELSHSLHPAALQHSGLAAALGKQAEEFSRRTGIATQFRTTVDRALYMPPEIALCFYRIAQEALHNTEKYSGAREASLHLDYRDGAFELIVEDGGVGFEPAGMDHASGLGLTSMEERVRFLKGFLEIQSGPGRGTRISARVPFVPPPPVAEPVPDPGMGTHK